MKAIIYAGIGLFSAASVYGVIDYYGAKKQGVLTDLYAVETAEKQPAVQVTDNTTASVLLKNTAPAVPVATVEKKALAAKEKKVKKQQRTITLKSFSRGEIREELPVVVTDKPAIAMAGPALVEVPITAPAGTETEKPAAKELPAKRPEINMGMFSRGSLKKRVKKSSEPEKVKEQ